MKTLTTAALAAVLSCSVAHAAHAQTGHPRHETQAQLRRQARVTEVQARQSALRLVPNGRIRSGELEREGGRLIYSFDIAVTGHRGIEEVNIDAMNGRVIAHQHEGPADERAEARAERQEAKKP
ncbi:MAG: PepSY domain-containing protein [Gemmatimonadetes bacterium]|nr:PepSY domain-containing protein [Gemmatimonadota bacterium]